MTAQLSLDHMAEFFGTTGPLATCLDHYEERHEQVQLATHVADALASGRDLVAEAGTGTGKTLAYLAPAIASGLRVVISTGTKNLQDQIVHKDIPILEKALGEDIDVQVMKGRTNYLCHLRADRALAQRHLPTLEVQQSMHEITQWREITETGDRAELGQLREDLAVWPQMTANSEQCLGRKCQDFERCWVTTMRRRAQTAQIVVVNHHLYFADASLRMAVGNPYVDLIPPHDVVIFDEAHDLDDVASQHFGVEISERRILNLCKEIGQALENQSNLREAVLPALTTVELHTRQLFDCLPFGQSRQRFSPQRLDPALMELHAELDQSLNMVENQLGPCTDEELQQLGRRAAAIRAECAFLLFQPVAKSALIETTVGQLANQQPSDEDESESPSQPPPYVHYLERTGHNRKLVARPLEVAPMMKQLLSNTPALYVSATLAVDGDMSHYQRRAGIEDADRILVDSPFDYKTQMRLYLPTDLPQPNDASFAGAAAERSLALVTASEGGAFVLCTSYNMVAHIAALLRQYTSLDIIAQGDGPRAHLLEAFKSHPQAVLVATMSFWQGVDVPGPNLRLVVIDRIPFASPGDPLVAARIDNIKAAGQSPFREYQLPQAAILLRQGLGRLIRRQTDEGLVAILDRRISKSGYGRTLLRSLPEAPILAELDAATDYLAAMQG